jgi:hypothetical protein
MTRLYPGTQITRQGKIRDADGTLTDPTTIKFFWKVDRGEETEVTPTKITTGVYNALFKPEIGGTVYTRWEATSPDLTIEDFFPLSRSQFNDYR